MNSHLKSKYSNLNIITLYYIMIAILTIYATYKNGIVLYNKHLIQLAAVFKPIILMIIAIGIPILIDAVYKTFIKKQTYELKQDYFPIYMGLITLCLPINISIILFLILTIIFSCIKVFYNLNINYYSITKLLIVLILLILGKYTYLSIYDLKIETNLTTLDMFLGRGVGGLATSNILLLLICYIVLCFNFTYKKEIPIISFVSYFVTLIIYSILFRSNLISNVKELINSEFIYAVIFIATMSFYSPIDFKSRIIFAILVGVFSFIFNLIINIYEGVFVAIIISNIILIIIDKLGVIKNEHKRI